LDAADQMPETQSDGHAAEGETAGEPAQPPQSEEN
jgi:hypothetical protein